MKVNIKPAGERVTTGSTDLPQRWEDARTRIPGGAGVDRSCSNTAVTMVNAGALGEAGPKPSKGACDWPAASG